MSSGENNPGGTRAGLIETIRTPLGFFALIILVAEALLGISATVLREDVDPVYVLAVMVALIFFLIVLVATFALFRPEALYGRRLEPTAPASADRDPVTEQVRTPSILCASTVGSSAEEFGRYAEGMSRYFADVSVMRDLSLDALRLALKKNRFQLVHLVTQVGVQGALCVGEQQITPGEVRDLLDMNSVHLVVMTGCDSLPLACELARVANVIVAPTTAVRSDVVQWTDSFYHLLARGIPISRAYSASSGVSRAPVMLVLTKDVAFSR